MGKTLRNLLLICWATLLVPAASLWAAPDIQSPDSIRQAAEQFVRSQSGNGAGTLTVEAGRLDPRLRLQACDEALEAFTAAGQAISGNTSIGVRCSAPRAWTIFVPVRVSREQSVVILSRSLQRDARLNADVLSLVVRDTSQLGFGYFTRVEEVEGLTLRRAAAAGTIINPSLVAVPPTIRRGEQVTLIAQRSGIAIRAPGRALSDAQIGQTLRVRNLSSERVVEGVVMGPGEVQVHAP